MKTPHSDACCSTWVDLSTEKLPIFHFIYQKKLSNCMYKFLLCTNKFCFEILLNKCTQQYRVHCIYRVHLGSPRRWNSQQLAHHQTKRYILHQRVPESEHPPKFHLWRSQLLRLLRFLTLITPFPQMPFSFPPLPFSSSSGSFHCACILSGRARTGIPLSLSLVDE